MPIAIAEREVRLENHDIAAAMELLSMRTEDHRMKLEEMRLVDSMTGRQHQREQEAKDSEIRRLTVENEENRQVREHEKEMKRLEMEDSNNAREHELIMNHETQEKIKLKLESDKKKEDLEKLKQQRVRLQHADNRHARKHKEKMAALEVERLESAEEIRRQRLDERRIVTEENAEQISELSNRCEQLESQRPEKEEQDIRSLRNHGLVATGVGAASGAISGALGTTAAVGLAAGVAGAATVLAPVAGAVGVMIGAGYVYKKVTSSNRA